MSSLTAIFGHAPGKSEHSEKLLHLYWNRAELKKEFAGMRREQFKLKDRIKQQEGATARLQQKLEHLEELLIDPDWAGNVIVFYQLRGLALRCQRKLAKFSEQLKQQREKRQHGGLLLKWNEERTRETRAVERTITEQREKTKELEERLLTERNRLMSMNGFLKIFRRRSVTSVLDKLAAEIDRAHEEEQGLLETLDEIRNRTLPENQGLDLQTKRSVNFMILSFAQQLFLHFADDDLAALTKEAVDKSVGATNYGNRQDCQQFLARIQKRTDALEQNSNFASLLQTRARMIAKHALFRSDSDAVPVAGTVSTVYDLDDTGLARKSEANLLGENYWGIAKTLSR